MGILDTSSRVLLEFKADTKGARREIKKLTGEQKKAAKETIDAQERQNKSLEKQIATLGKVALGVGAAVGAYKGLTAAAEHYAKRQQLVSASAGADIGAIQAATKGLLTETQALQFAAASLNTDFKLSQREMEEVAKFMIVLRNQGNDLAEVYNEVTKSIVEGNTEGLKKFGIVIKESAGTLAAHEATMARIAEENKKAGGSILRAGDDALIASKQFQDAFDRLADAMGKFANSPIVTGALGIITKVVEGFNIITGDRREFGLSQTIAFKREQLKRFDTPGGQRTAEIIRQEIAELEALLQAQQNTARDQRLLREELLRRFIAAAPTIGDAIGVTAAQRLLSAFPSGALATGGGSGMGRRRIPSAPNVAIPGGPTGSLGEAAAGSGLGGVQLDRQFGAGSILDPESLDFSGARIDPNFERLEQMGEQFSRLTDGILAANDAISIFQSAGQQAFGAWLSGTSSLSDAFENFGQTVLQQIAASMWGRGLEAAGMAAFALAQGIFTLDPKALAASAKYGAASAALLGGAALLGSQVRGGTPTASASTGGGALPAAAAGASAGGGTGQSSQTFIVVQSPFEDNPREAQRRARRFLDRAQNGGSGTGAVIRA